MEKSGPMLVVGGMVSSFWVGVAATPRFEGAFRHFIGGEALVDKDIPSMKEINELLLMLLLNRLSFDGV
jgi:hypothetical protein